MCCGGVVGMLGVYGFLQERVMAMPSGRGPGAGLGIDGEKHQTFGFIV